jgi:hypothetical protein
VAHYSVFVALEDGRLVARATRDFLLPVSAAVLVVAADDEISWLCESGELQLVFEQSPFQSGVREIGIPRGGSAPPEARIVRTGNQPEVFRYAVRLDSGADRPAEGVAYIIVEAGKPGRSEAFIFESRDREFLNRAPGEDSMAAVTHTLKISKGSVSKNVYDYVKVDDDDSKKNRAHTSPDFVVKPGDKVVFQALSPGITIIAFGPDGSPFDGAVFVLKQNDTTDRLRIKDHTGKDKVCFGYKYTTVVVDSTDAIVDDPQVIVDNTGG